MTNVWFTADTHFGHANIIEYCNRPFETVEEMDKALIATWNDCVGENDTVYHLGDFAFGQAVVLEILEQLNGRIFLVEGNHDRRYSYKKWVKECPNLIGVSTGMYRLVYGNKRIYLNHFSMRTWPASHYGTWHLYGHSHGMLEPYGLSMDVGIDACDYKPVSYDLVYATLKSFEVADSFQPTTKTPR